MVKSGPNTKDINYGCTNSVVTVVKPSCNNQYTNRILMPYESRGGPAQLAQSNQGPFC